MNKDSKTYDHSYIEEKWQKEWSKKKIYETKDDFNAPKFYILDMFPYPSGEGLHVGHPKGYIATDIVSRMKRMQGFNVLHPMGFDAFGLPAENYAIKTKTNPIDSVKKNVARYKKQLEILGFDYDWEREINTTDPKFYKWTQWIFLKLLEKGLAYESYEPINWCPVDKTGLANEDVEDGKCERCGATVEKKPMRQWVLKITDYAERLLADLDYVDWPESIKTSQKNWIGKSEGVEIDFKIKDSEETIKIFTTRPETILGVTFIGISKDHKLADRKDIKAINPANNKEIPVLVAEYVLSDYGTGAIMGVPAYNDKDFEFATKNNISTEKSEFTDKIFGKKVTKYKLRDWVFSRQRYWGEPIPVLHSLDGKIIPVPEKELPVELPKVKSYEPTGTGESPLANIKKWMNVKIGKEKYTRESNTMPQWAGSSWYYLRYMDPENKKALVDKEKEKYWNQIDLYVGGAEHATRHLIYARFWHKFLYDIGVVSTLEPFKRLQHVGLIMAEDGRKMSKRYGNVINPDDIALKYGADTLRVYEMFMGPFDQQIKWDTNSILGARRFIERVWKMKEKVGLEVPSKKIESVLHKTIKKVSLDIENMHFNTAISSLMIALNEFEKEIVIPKSVYEIFVQLIAPFAPHVTEEIWKKLGKNTSIHTSKWPEYDDKKIIEDKKTIVIQLNGKTKGTIEIEGDIDNAQLEEKAKEFLKINEVKKSIIVPGRLVNILTT